MTEEKLREKLLKALKEELGNKNSLIIPEADRWDIAIIYGGIFVAGIELKSTLIRNNTKNVKNWYTKYGSKYSIKEDKKQKLGIGTIRKFKDIWFAQERDPVGQATIYHLYSKSSSKPMNILVVEVKEEKKYYRVSNITWWVKEIEERIKKSQDQEIIPKSEENPVKLIKQKEKYNNLNEIARKICKCIY